MLLVLVFKTKKSFPPSVLFAQVIIIFFLEKDQILEEN